MNRGIMLCALGLVVVGGSAIGQPWTTTLQHKLFTSFEEADRAGTRISGLAAYPQQPPEPVEWPTFTCDDPVYGRFYVHVAPQPEVMAPSMFALDRSGKHEDKYDILYVDVNRDNRFGEDERLEGQPATIRAGQEGIDFGMITFPVKRPNHDGLHFRVWVGPQPTTQTRSPYVLVNYRSWCCLQGEIEMNGRKQTVRLLDANMNGIFTDAGSDMVAIGDGPPVSLSRLMSRDGKFLTVEVADDASTISISPYAGKTGKLVFDIARNSGAITDLYAIVATEDGVSLQCRATGDEGFELPEGNYRITYVSISCEDKDYRWSTYFREYAASVKAEEPTVLKLGKPMRLEVLTTGATHPGATADVQYCVRGALGEGYQNFTRYVSETGRSEPNNPKVMIRNAAGDAVAEAVLEPG